jgi:AcrR family transcriptional regulator
MKAQSVKMRRAPRSAAARKRRARSAPSWRRDPEGRKERVLAAAAKLFGERGFANVATAMIADSAGVSEGIIFHYFRTKQALLGEVAARYGRGFSDAMFGGISAMDPVPDPEVVMRRAFAYVRFSDPLFGVFLLADDPADSVSAKVANRGEIVARLSGFFAGWRDRGEIVATDPRILAELCFGLVEAALRECYARGEPIHEREEKYVTEVARCMRALLGLPGRSPS